MSLNYCFLLVVIWANQFTHGQNCCNCDNDAWNDLIQNKLTASGMKQKNVNVSFDSFQCRVIIVLC